MPREEGVFTTACFALPWWLWDRWCATLLLPEPTLPWERGSERLFPPALDVLSLRAREAAEEADRVEGLAPARERGCESVSV